MKNGIVNSMSFLTFCGKGDQVKLVPAHKATNAAGEEFEAPQSVALIKDGEVLAFAAFSSNLEAMDAKTLVREAPGLNVVQLESGTYKICRPGEGSWETLNL